MDRAPLEWEARQGWHNTDQESEGGRSQHGAPSCGTLVVRWETGGWVPDLELKATVTTAVSCQELVCPKPFVMPA